MLTRLADERATGVLDREYGTLHLAEGRVVHAESPLAPGLDELLAAHGTLDAEAWRDAEAGADEGRLRRHGVTPVDQGHAARDRRRHRCRRRHEPDVRLGRYRLARVDGLTFRP